jgi:hypothetical protein
MGMGLVRIVPFMSRAAIRLALAAAVFGFGVSSLGLNTGQALTSNIELRLKVTSPRMTLLEVDEDGLVGSPDGHITFLREDGRLRMWAPINGGTVELATTNFLNVHAMTIPAEETFWPRGNGFDSEYAGGSKVLRLPNGDLAMIYHGEHHPCAGDRAEVNVGLAISDDDGATWHRRGKILTASPYDFESCEERRFFGAGSFSGVVSPDGKYLYLYHHIWHPEQSCYITVSRSEISSGLGPGTWTRYYQDSWSQPGLGGLGSDMWREPPGQEGCMAGIPSVSWNPTYKMWLAVFVTFKGFAYTSSPDGVNWATPRMLMRGVTLVAPESLIDHEQYIYYPSLIDPRANQDGRTNKKSLLIYAFGGWTAAHHMVANRVEISAVQVAVPDTLPPTGAGMDVMKIILGALFVCGAGLGLFSRNKGSNRPLGGLQTHAK